MSAPRLRAPYILSAIIAILAAVASVAGLFVGDLYRDEALFVAVWRGNDLVTLVVAAPLLIAALIVALRGSQRAQLVWVAMLGYMVYNYAYYLFGAAFNPLFLMYVVLFSASLFSLIFALPKLDVEGISRTFQAGTPVKWIAGFLVLVGVSLGGMWITASLAALDSGEVPLTLVFALDLSVVVPSMVLAGIWLWKRQPWGYVLGTMMAVKGAAYTLALISMQAFAIDLQYDPLTPFYGAICSGCLACAWLLLANMRSARQLPGSGAPKGDDGRRRRLGLSG